MRSAKDGRNAIDGIAAKFNLRRLTSSLWRLSAGFCLIAAQPAGVAVAAVEGARPINLRGDELCILYNSTRL